MYIDQQIEKDNGNSHSTILNRKKQDEDDDNQGE